MKRTKKELMEQRERMREWRRKHPWLRRVKGREYQAKWRMRRKAIVEAIMKAREEGALGGEGL
jgi:hypothetical protein